MRILVTGGAGFIGSHTAEALIQRGDEVIVVDEMNDYYNVSLKQANVEQCRKAAMANQVRFTFHKADCADKAVMAELFEVEKPDLVCHLAARAGVRPSIQVISYQRLFPKFMVVGS